MNVRFSCFSLTVNKSRKLSSRLIYRRISCSFCGFLSNLVAAFILKQWKKVIRMSNFTISGWMKVWEARLIFLFFKKHLYGGEFLSFCIFDDSWLNFSSLLILNLRRVHVYYAVPANIIPHQRFKTKSVIEFIKLNNRTDWPNTHWINTGSLGWSTAHK